MRELTVQEMDQASGGILPVVGLILAVGSAVVRHRVAAWVINGAGIALAGYGAAKWLKGEKKD